MGLYCSKLPAQYSFCCIPCLVCLISILIYFLRDFYKFFFDSGCSTRSGVVQLRLLLWQYSLMWLKKQFRLYLEPVKDMEVPYKRGSGDFWLALQGLPNCYQLYFLFSLFSKLNIFDRVAMISLHGGRFVHIFLFVLRLCFGILEVFW